MEPGLVVQGHCSGPNSATIKSGPVSSYLTLCCLYQCHRSVGKGMAKVPFTLRFPTFSLAPQPQGEQPADLCAFGSEFGCHISSFT